MTVGHLGARLSHLDKSLLLLVDITTHLPDPHLLQELVVTKQAATGRRSLELLHHHRRLLTW
jgi:hypothetical protein